jgi:sugar phosphate isomerase/epimerase
MLSFAKKSVDFCGPMCYDEKNLVDEVAYMEKIRLGIGALPGTDKTVLEQLPMLKSIGFDAFFTHWDNHLGEYRVMAETLGLEYAFVHGPNTYTEQMWQDCPEAAEGVREWIQCLEDCAAHGIPMVVGHAFKSFRVPEPPTPEGIRNYSRIVEKAKELGVKFALENAEGNTCLAALFAAFADDDNVGFCWDTGHTLCYSHSWTNMADLYGHRLFCTHLQDNLGVRGESGELTPADDIHLLPFAGKVPWQDVMRSLKQCDYRGILMLEVKKKCYPDMTTQTFLEESYRRACRLREMLQK